MACPFLHEVPGVGCDADVLVQPRASRTEVTGVHDDRIKIRLAAPPVDGAANEELVRFLSDALGIPKRGVAIQVGETGRRKKIRIQGLSADQVRERLGV